MSAKKFSGIVTSLALAFLFLISADATRAETHVPLVYEKMPGCAVDVGIGGIGAYGSVWVAGCDGQAYHWINSTWVNKGGDT